MSKDGFSAARDAWLAAPLPEGSPDDDVDELKAELAYWDYMVAETVLPLADGRPWQEPPVDVESGIRDMRRQVDELARKATGDDIDRLNRYKSYIEVLAAVYEEAAREARRATW